MTDKRKRMPGKKIQPKDKPKAIPEEETGVIDTIEKATNLVKSSYSSIDSVEFLVLPNGSVYYGSGRDSGRAYAKRNNLKTFDVKL